MIDQEQLAGFVDNALAPGAHASVEAELKSDPESLRYVLEQQQMDRALRSLLCNETRREKLRESILVAVSGQGIRELEAQVLADTVGSPAARSTSPRSTGWWPRTRTWLSTVRDQFQSQRLAWAACACALAFVALGAWLFFRPAPANLTIGQFAAVTGQPALKRGAHQAALSPRPQTAVHMGDRIETGDADKAELVFTDGTTLRLGFNTVIEITESKGGTRGQSITPLRPSEVKLTQGQVWTKVQKLTNAPPYAIHTEAATAIARGTEFGVKLTRTGATAAQGGSSFTAVLSVKEGVVDFTNALGSIQATAMTESTARADLKPTEPRRLQTLQVVRLGNSVETHSLSSQLDWPDTAERLSLGGGWAGFKVRDFSVAAAGPNEIRVIQVSTNSPAANAGLRTGDVLTAMEGQALTEASQVSRALLLRADMPTSLTVRRGNQDATVTLAARHRSALLAGPGLSRSQAGEVGELTRKWVEEGVTADLSVPSSVGDLTVGGAAENNLGVLLEAVDEMGPAIRAYGRAVRSGLQVPLYRFNLGLALRKIGSFERASEELASAVQLAPESVEARKRWAEVQSLVGNDGEALVQTEAALGMAPEDHGLWELKSRLLSKLGRNAEAIAAARKAAETGPGCTMALMELAGILYRQGEPVQAEATYRKAMALASYDPLLRNNLGVVLKGRGQLDEAEKSFREAIAYQPDFVLAYRNLAEVYMARRQWAEAEASLQQALEFEEGDLGVTRDFAQLFLAQGRLDDAERQFRKVLENFPYDAGSYGGLASVMSRRGQSAEEERLLQKALELDPEFGDAWNDLGELLRLRGELPEAVRCYQRAMELDPNNLNPYNNLGVVYAMQGNFGEAERMFRGLLDRAAGNPRVNPVNFLVNLAMVCGKQGKLTEAEGFYRQALAVRPKDAGIWNSLAWFLADHRLKLDEALTLARRAVQSEPDSFAFLDTLGWVHFQRDELEQADDTLRKALTLAGNEPAAAEIQEHLNKVRAKRSAEPR